MRKYLVSEKYDYYEDRVVQRKWFKIDLTLVAFIEAMIVTVPFVYVAYVSQFAVKIGRA